MCPRHFLPKGVRKMRHVPLLGRVIHLGDTPDGLRAISKGAIFNPDSVERYLRGKFGDALVPVRTEMKRLASRFTPEQLNQEGFHLYEQCRPAVPRGERGWGAKGVLEASKINPSAGTPMLSAAGWGHNMLRATASWFRSPSLKVAAGNCHSQEGAPVVRAYPRERFFSDVLRQTLA
jgi:hypothetical protein